MRLAGFKQLLAVDGEPVSFRDDRFCAVVDRGMDATLLNRGQLAFEDRNQTRVEFLLSVLELPPRVGEYFEDECGDHHRVKVVRRTDITWRCDCEMASPESDE